MAENLSVLFAVYGALADGNENSCQAVSVKDSLQNIFDDPANDGVVVINNSNLGGDPSKDNKKHFAAIVNVNGTPQYFACQENQTIDFYHWKTPSL